MPKKNKEVKIDRIGSIKYRKLVRFVLWIALAFLIYKGVISIINVDKTNVIKKELFDSLQSQKSVIDIEDGAVAFAEGFVREYFTYYKDKNDYVNRLKIYSDLDFDFKANNMMEVVATNSIKKEWLGRNLLLVDIKAKVNMTEDYQNNYLQKYVEEENNLNSNDNTNSENLNGLMQNNVDNENKIDSAQNVDYKPILNDYFIRVTVFIDKEGNYLISDYPVFIPETKKSNMVSSDIDLDVLDDSSINDEIKKSIVSFIQAYCEGEETDIEYFMLEKQDISVLENDFLFSRVDSVKIYESNNDYFAKALYRVKHGSQEYIQQMVFDIVLKDGKYLIRDFNVSLDY